MADLTLTRGNTLPNSGTKTDLHNLIDMAVVTITNIVDADVSATAAIAGTKISPDFGAQNIVTTGTLAAHNTTVTGTLKATGAVDFDSTVNIDGALTVVAGITGNFKGRIVSYNSSESASLSATNATTDYVDSGLTAITFTPSNAENLIFISWGLAGSNSSNSGGLKSCVRIGSTNYTANEVGVATNGNGATDILTSAGSIIIKLAASSQVVKVYFMNGGIGGLTTSTANAKRAWLHIAEVYNG